MSEKPLGNNGGESEEARDEKGFFKYAIRHWQAAAIIGLAALLGLPRALEMLGPVFGIKPASEAHSSGAIDAVEYALLKKDVAILTEDMKELHKDIRDINRALNSRGIFASRPGASPADVREMEEAGGRFRSAGAGGSHP